MTEVNRASLDALAKSTKRCAREAFDTQPLDLGSSAAHKQAGHGLFVNAMSTRKRQRPAIDQQLEVAP